MPPNMMSGMGKVAGHLGMNFGTEIIYSFVIIVCSLMIYFGTKELYELSSYKGIKYFRLAFLFFAFAYFFRSFIKFILISSDLSLTLTSLNLFNSITLCLFMYFSSMAIFYLLYSVMWKKWNHESKRVYLFHFLALVIALIVVLTRNPLIYLIINVVLFLFILAVVLIAKNNVSNKSKGHGLYMIYILLFVFWILNILDILIPNFLQAYQLLIYLGSSGIFLLILYKVIKKTGAN